MKKDKEVLFFFDDKPTEKMLSKKQIQRQCKLLFIKTCCLIAITIGLYNLTYFISYWGGV